MARPPKSSGVQSPDQPQILPSKLVSGIQTVNPSTGFSPDMPLSDSALSTFNASVQMVRNQGSVYAALRLLRRISGDTAMAIASFVRLADTGIVFEAYDYTHQLVPQGANLIKSITTRLDHLVDYTYGFDDRLTVQGLSECFLNEVLLSGACSAELVLDKYRLPFRVQPVSPMHLKWKISQVQTGQAAHKIMPWQQLQGVKVELDIPTFFYHALDYDVTTIYSQPALEAAVNASVFHAETVEEIRRVVKRTGHSRLQAILNTERMQKAMPKEFAGDPAKRDEWVERQRKFVEDQIAKLSPEAALVLFDYVRLEYLTAQIGQSADYGPFMEIVDGHMATAHKTPPSVLGKRMGGSQSVSSTESLLFIKQAQGIQKCVAGLLSRLMTLAARLYGFEGYIVAKYRPINLRPDEELEAFTSMRQARLLELLSLGFLTDAEASERLGTGVPPTDMVPLSGTGFYNGSKTDVTGMSPQDSASGDPSQRAVSGNKPSAPKKAGGKSQRMGYRQVARQAI